MMTDYMSSEMSDSQREQVEKLVKTMLCSLHESEKYLSDYLAGRTNAAKAYGVIVQTADYLQQSAISILKMHNKEAGDT